MVNPTSPSFSVVVPLFNKANYVEAAISSVLSQDHLPHEVLVVDDGSTDRGPDKVLAFRHPLVRLLRQKNGGVSSARNLGIAEASGEFVAFLDADDEYGPNFLSNLANLKLRFPTAEVLCSGFEKFDDSGRAWPTGLLRRRPGQPQLVEDFYREWSRQPFTCSSSIAVCASVLRSLDVLFPTGERLGEDQDLWFRLAERVPVAYINLPLARYRVGVQGSATAAVQVIDELLPSYVRLQQRLNARAVPGAMRAGARRLLAAHRLNVARANLALGRLAKAQGLLFDRNSAGHPTYWLRTSWLWMAASLAAKRAS